VKNLVLLLYAIYSKRQSKVVPEINLVPCSEDLSRI